MRRRKINRLKVLGKYIFWGGDADRRHHGGFIIGRASVSRLEKGHPAPRQPAREGALGSAAVPEDGAVRWTNTSGDALLTLVNGGTSDAVGLAAGNRRIEKRTEYRQPGLSGFAGNDG